MYSVRIIYKSTQTTKAGNNNMNNFKTLNIFFLIFTISFANNLKASDEIIGIGNDYLDQFFIYQASIENELLYEAKVQNCDLLALDGSIGIININKQKNTGEFILNGKTKFQLSYEQIGRWIARIKEYLGNKKNTVETCVIL